MTTPQHATADAIRDHARHLAAQMEPMTPDEITAAATVLRHIRRSRTNHHLPTAERGTPG